MEQYYVWSGINKDGTPWDVTKSNRKYKTARDVINDHDNSTGDAMGETVHGRKCRCIIGICCVKEYD